MSERPYGQLAGESEPDFRTGTRRIDLWRESAEGGAYGDPARGDALSSEYANGDQRVRVSVYPIDGREAFGWDDEESYPFDVEECTEVWTVDIGPDFEDRGQDIAEITYDHPSYVSFQTLESAQSYAENYGQRDLSGYIYAREETNA